MRTVLLLSFIAMTAVADTSEKKQNIFANTPCKRAYEYHFLNRAVAFGDMFGVKYLVEGGVNIDGMGYEMYLKCGGYTEYSSPLMVAVYTENIEIVEYLLKHGANPNIVEGEGFAPLDIAQKKNFSDIVTLLKKYGAKNSRYAKFLQ